MINNNKIMFFGVVQNGSLTCSQVSESVSLFAGFVAIKTLFDFALKTLKTQEILDIFCAFQVANFCECGSQWQVEKNVIKQTVQFSGIYEFLLKKIDVQNSN